MSNVTCHQRVMSVTRDKLTPRQTVKINGSKIHEHRLCLTITVYS